MFCFWFIRLISGLNKIYLSTDRFIIYFEGNETNSNHQFWNCIYSVLFQRFCLMWLFLSNAYPRLRTAAVKTKPQCQTPKGYVWVLRVVGTHHSCFFVCSKELLQHCTLTILVHHPSIDPVVKGAFYYFFLTLVDQPNCTTSTSTLKTVCCV